MFVRLTSSHKTPGNITRLTRFGLASHKTQESTSSTPSTMEQSVSAAAAGRCLPGAAHTRMLISVSTCVASCYWYHDNHDINIGIIVHRERDIYIFKIYNIMSVLPLLTVAHVSYTNRVFASSARLVNWLNG